MSSPASSIAEFVCSCVPLIINDSNIKKIKDALDPLPVDERVQVIANAISRSILNPDLAINLVHISAKLLSKEDRVRVLERFFETEWNLLENSRISETIAAILKTSDQCNQEALAKDHYQKM